MDKILVIEDMEEIREKNVKTIKKLLCSQGLEKSVEVISVDNELMGQFTSEESEQDDQNICSVEDRFGRYLIGERDIKLVVVDRDLHKYESYIRSESTITEGASLAAVPVCGYSRRSRADHPGIRLNWLAESTATPMIEVPKETEKLAEHVVEIYHGNKIIAEKMPSIENAQSLPKTLSILLDREDQSTYFVNYQLTLPVRTSMLNLTDQAGFDYKFFTAYKLGLWLYKFILKFPGILLNERTAAAYLNLGAEDFAEHSSIFEEFKYTGPFSLFSSYWWRYNLDDALIKQNLNDGAQYIKELTGTNVEPLDEKGEEQVFCMVTEKVIPFTQSIRPRMVPDGADLARIERSTAEKWQMYLS